MDRTLEQQPRPPKKALEVEGQRSKAEEENVEEETNTVGRKSHGKESQ